MVALAGSPKKKVDGDVDGSGKRSSGRRRKPTSRSLYAEKESTLLQKLDALPSDMELSNDEEGESDVSYRPSRGSGRGRSSGRVRKGVVVDVGPGLRRGGSKVGSRDERLNSKTGLSGDLASVIDSDSDLPSPSTAMAAGKRGNEVVVEAPLGQSETSRGKRRVDSQLDEESSVAGQGARHKAGSSGNKASSSGYVLVDDEDGDESAVDEDGDATVDELLDFDLVHEDLRDVYRGMSWINGYERHVGFACAVIDSLGSLRRARFVGYPMSEGVFDDFVPASYGGLLDKVSPRVKSKLARSIAFVRYKDFGNVARVPLANYLRAWECLRLPRCDGVRNAGFVLTGVSLQSHLSQGREVGQGYVKQLFVRPIENDWDIFQCNVGTVLNDSKMHAPGRNNGLVFQTKRQGWFPRAVDKGGDDLAPAPYSSKKDGSSSGQGVPSGSTSSAKGCADDEDAGDTDVDVSSVNVLRKGCPPYRLFHEGVPLYDGRTRVGARGFRFEAEDWENYTALPVYPRSEVEDESLVTVVFTLTGFRGANNAHHTVHFNLLFAIVLGKLGKAEKEV
ncbi:hypothetical protein VNI00_016202 [Paramarasmius palmivorus]|uniref:Uncharacterized protein n=1 Tax=Paramarasmius palmivorus TaxID=297713 RepID=A0AAW0BEC4_9AGAR